jgi:hypothetical protein
MAYTTPPTFASGAALLAAELNVLGDDIVYLHGVSDGVTFSAVKVDRAGAGSQSIPNSTATNVTWTNEVFDYGSWWSTGATITVPAGAIPAGFTTIALQIIALVRFVSNGTGGRKIIVNKNGSEEDSFAIGALSGDPTTVALTAFFTAVSGDAITVQVFQNSGGALNMDVARISVVRFLPVA